MGKNELIQYTIIIIVTCNLIGFLFSVLSIHFSFLNKFKIQKRKIKPKTFYKRLPLILFNIILLIIISFLGLYFFYDFGFFKEGESIFQDFNFLLIFAQLFLILVIDDLYFYFLHSFMHKNKYVLKKIHKIHHRAITPVALEYIYVHPIEWMMGYLGPFLGILVISYFGPVSFFSFWAYQIIRNLHELDVHSGLKSKFSKWIPFWGETEHHDKHHEALNGNYATTFTFWDEIFGTKI